VADIGGTLAAYHLDKLAEAGPLSTATSVRRGAKANAPDARRSLTPRAERDSSQSARRAVTTSS
jgi:hypothetical protein